MEDISSTAADVRDAVALDAFKFNAPALREAIQFLRERDDQYRDMTVEDVAEHIGISPSTLKKLKRGEIADPRCSSLWLICSRLGLDPRILLGLAPDRDYAREAETFNSTLMDEMRSRIEDMTRKAAVDDARLVRLREMVLEKGEAMSRAESQQAILTARVDQQADTIAQQECRLESKRRTIEQLGAEIGGYKATIDARDRTVANLERLNLRHRRTCKGLFVALCVLVLLAASTTSLLVWEWAHNHASAAQHDVAP